jgi:nuclear migration protein JNM1
VNATNVDFSDRLNLHQRSYRTYNRRRRPGQFHDDPEEFGDFSDQEEEEETLDRKLARLRREVEEIQALVGQDESESTTPTENEHVRTSLENIETISDSLDAIYSKRRGAARGAETDFAQTLRAFTRDTKDPKRATPKNDVPVSTLVPASQPAIENAQLLRLLSKAADFDARLAFVEKAMGLTGTNMPDTGDDGTKPILPTLDKLERLIGTALAQPAQLEAVQSKTRQLLKDTEKYTRLRAEHAEANGTKPLSSTNGQSGPEDLEVPGQASKVNALYGVLPTIDSLSPTLPLLLDRLRTLRLLHASAADANTVLDGIQKRQDEQAEGIKQWRVALDEVEENLEDGETALAENIEKMGGLIRKLEGKLEEK